MGPKMPARAPADLPDETGEGGGVLRSSDDWDYHCAEEDHRSDPDACNDDTDKDGSGVERMHWGPPIELPGAPRARTRAFRGASGKVHAEPAIRLLPEHRLCGVHDDRAAMRA
jgi:hypothetical protein